MVAQESDITSVAFTHNNRGCTDIRIGHFAVVCLVTRPMNANEAGGDLALMEPLCFSHLNANLSL